MNRSRYLIIILILALLLELSGAVTLAQTLPVVQDNGTGNQYSRLDVNYVQITDLDLVNAKIESGSGYSISMAYGDDDRTYREQLSWKGKVNFGTRNVSNDDNAVMKTNTLPDVTLRFPGGAKTSDGVICDVLMEFKDVRVHLGESRTDKITDNTTVCVGIAAGWGGLICGPPRTAAGFAGRKSTAETGRNAGCTTAHDYLIKMKIVKKGTDTAISSSAYPTMLLEFKDLDIVDKTIKKSASDTARGNGEHSESIELVSGWLGNIVLGPDSSDLANTSLSNTQTTDRGNIRVKPDGPKIAAFIEKFNPPAADYGTLWSGFIAAVRPQGFSFYWHGSAGGGNKSLGSIGTKIGSQPTVLVKAKRNDPGAAGAILTRSRVNEWRSTTYLMNSSATYSYKPAPGWRMKSVKVDGNALTLSDDQKTGGGTYTFTKLNKYPLPERNIRTGQVLAAQKSGFYTIETAYEHLPDYYAVKTCDTESLYLHDDREITYTIRCDELYTDAVAGTTRLTDDLAGGMLELTGEPVVSVTGGTYTVNKTNNSGLDYTFRSSAASGTKPNLTITYKARVNWDKYFASGRTDIGNTCLLKGGATDNPPPVKVLSDLKVTKKVKGNLRDTTKLFEFQMSLSGLKPSTNYDIGSGTAFGTGGGAEITRVIKGKTGRNGITSDSSGNITFSFKMSNGMGIGLKGIPVGTEYTVQESSSDHRASYRLESENSDAKYVKQSDSNKTNNKFLSTARETLDKQDGVVTIAFTNTRNSAPVSGVTEKWRWMIIAAGIISGAAALYIIRISRMEVSGEVQDEDV